jgi:CRISPR-associated exonuclease Cas4
MKLSNYFLSNLELSERESIQISPEEIRQFIYCPRIIYFRRVYNTKFSLKPLMEKGVKYHSQIFKRNRKRKDSQILYNYYIENKALNLNCRLDTVKITNSGIIVEEIKRFGSPENIFRSHELQLLLTGLLAEIHFQKPLISVVIKYYNGKQWSSVPKEVDIDDLIVNLNQVRSMIKNQYIPLPTTNKEKCTECEFKRICFLI